MGSIPAKQQLPLYISVIYDNATTVVGVPFGDTQNEPIMLYGCVTNQDYQSASMQYPYIEHIQRNKHEELCAYTVDDDPTNITTIHVGGYLKPFKSIWGISVPECNDYYTNVPLSVSAHHFIIENDVILIIGTSYRHETALFALNVAELRRGGNKGGGIRHCQWTKAFVCSKRETMRFTDEGLLEVPKLNSD
jgi:hypothetical protein